MLVIIIHYTQPIEQIDQQLAAHRLFLKKYYENGLFIASGPQVPRQGGVIIAQCSKSQMESLLKEDPFYQQALANYQIIEFNAVLYCPELAQKLA